MLLGIFFVGLLIVIVGSEGYRFLAKPEQRFDARLFVAFWFTKAYVIAPLGILAIGREAVNPAMFNLYREEYMPHTAIMATVAWATFVASYSCGRGLRRPLFLRRRPVITERSAWILCGMLGIVAYVLFALRYGFDVVGSTNIRYGTVEGDRMGSAFLYARVYLWMAFFAYTSHMVHSDRTDSKWGLRMVSYLLLFFLVCYVTVQGASRASYIYIFAIPYLTVCYVLRKIWRPYLAVILVLLAMVFLLVGRTVIGAAFFDEAGNLGNAVWGALSEMSPADVAVDVVRTYSHPTTSIHASLAHAGSKIPYRLFSDLPLSVLFFLRVVGVEFDYGITYYNTLLAEGELSSSIPPGIVASGYYQLGWLGMVVWVSLYGCVCRLANDYLRQMTVIRGFSGVYVFAAFVLGNFVMVGDPRVYVIRLFFVLTVVLAFRLVFLRRYPHTLNTLAGHAPLSVRNEST